MNYGINRPIALWPRSEVFNFGVFQMQPHPRLSSINIKRLILYAKGKTCTGYTHLNYGVWKHVACDKLSISEDAAWTYFETCMIMSCQKREYLTEMESAISKAKNDLEIEIVRLQQCVDLYTFALFLYIHQINKLSLRSSVASVSAEWPGSSFKGVGDSPVRSNRLRQFKNMSEQYQLQFITESLVEIMELLSDSESLENEVNPNSNDDKRIPVGVLDSLSFLLEGTIDRMNSIKPLRDILFDPTCLPHVGYNELTKSFSLRSLHSWLRANICQCPFSVESCILKGSDIQWAAAHRESSVASPASRLSSSRQKIATNVHQLPPTAGFRGNKMLVATTLNQQFIARSSRFLKHTTVKLHRVSNSFIYLLAPLRCVSLDRCRKSTVVLGPVESTLTLNDCEDCLVIAPTRRVIVSGSRRCTLHLLCPTRPLLLQPPTANSISNGCDIQSCISLTLAASGGERIGNEGIVLAPYHTTYPDLPRHLGKAGLNPNINLWDKPLLFDYDFMRTCVVQGEWNNVWELIAPKNFFPFNIPLAPIKLTEESDSLKRLPDVKLSAFMQSGVSVKKKACDVCQGAIIGRDCETSCRSSNDGAVEESFGSPIQRTPLIVPLPPVYAEMIDRRRAAYESWRQLIQEANLTEEEHALFSASIEQRFKSWLVESGMLTELQSLETASNYLGEITEHSCNPVEEVKTPTLSISPPPVQRRKLGRRQQLSPTTAI
uniref:TBCC domain-containing protein 1 n=1 Tax=Mesocestoides corti TaxID=53468 RepID=A0A5K3FJ91_MESCO